MEDAAPSLGYAVWENSNILGLLCEQESTVQRTKGASQSTGKGAQRTQVLQSHFWLYLWTGGTVEEESGCLCATIRTPQAPGAKRTIVSLQSLRTWEVMKQSQASRTSRVTGGWHSVAIQILLPAAVCLNHKLRTKEKSDLQESGRGGWGVRRLWVLGFLLESCEDGRCSQGRDGCCLHAPPPPCHTYHKVICLIRFSVNVPKRNVSSHAKASKPKWSLIGRPDCFRSQNCSVEVTKGRFYSSSDELWFLSCKQLTSKHRDSFRVLVF